MYAGEHTAGTEFMIGPLFVAWGADAASLIFGLLLGKLGTTDVWHLLTPPAGTEQKIGFLGIVCFSWFCNAAMHLGMADLSVLRFARQPSAGWASAAGMFLGHYVAWICAALLLIYWVRVHGVDPAVGKDPGTMVNDAVGWAGLLCVIIACGLLYILLAKRSSPARATGRI